MVQRTVLKVDINCLKCKQQLLKAVSALQGVDKVEVDAAKGTMTVIGDADPYEIIVRTRKTGKFAEVVSIGPPPAPPKQDGQKKEDQEKKEPTNKDEQKKSDQIPQVHHQYMIPYAYMPAHHNCPVCDRTSIIVHDGRWEDPNPSCSII